MQKQEQIQWSNNFRFGKPKIRTSTLKKIKFDFRPDNKRTFENKIYPGDKGQVTIFNIKVPIRNSNEKISFRQAKIIVFDSQFIRNELLTCRLIYGKPARQIYRITAYTIAKLLNEYPNICLELFRKAREHLILRAGRVMELGNYFPKIKITESNFKRFSIKTPEMFEAKIKQDNIDWGDEPTQIASESCSASGATVKKFSVEAFKQVKNLKTIILNIGTASTLSVLRALNTIPENIKLIVICYGGLFPIYRKDIVIHKDLTIFSGTIINILKTADSDPTNIALGTFKSKQYLKKIYLADDDDVKVIDDIVGEAGEKFEDSPEEPILYDLQCGWVLGHKWRHPIWEEKLIKALAIPGILEKLEKWNKEASSYYKKQYEKMNNLIPITL